jgi:hypothetical protein
MLDDSDAERRADRAGRYLARARSIYQASRQQQREAVAQAHWAERRRAIAEDRARWADQQQQQQDWRAYHAEHDAEQQAHWDDERYRREAEAARFAAVINDAAAVARDLQASRDARARADQHIGPGPGGPANPGGPSGPSGQGPQGGPARQGDQGGAPNTGDHRLPTGPGNSQGGVSGQGGAHPSDQSLQQQHNAQTAAGAGLAVQEGQAQRDADRRSHEQQQHDLVLQAQARDAAQRQAQDQQQQALAAQHAQADAALKAKLQADAERAHHDAAAKTQLAPPPSKPVLAPPHIIPPGPPPERHERALQPSAPPSSSADADKKKKEAEKAWLEHRGLPVQP